MTDEMRVNLEKFRDPARKAQVVRFDSCASKWVRIAAWLATVGWVIDRSAVKLRVSADTDDAA